MINFFKWLLLMEFVIITCQGAKYETDDSIIIEAAERPTSRTRRQIFFSQPGIPPYQQQPNYREILGEGATCLTSKGTLGYCTSFRQCYPYFKIPDLSVWESWVLGNYDSCSYFNEDGRQAFGVCCTNPVTTPNPIFNENEPVSTTPMTDPHDNRPILTNKIPYPGNVYPGLQQAVPANWPPQAPTHPPDHAAPTHPPNYSTAGYPSSSGWPTKPPSTYYPTFGTTPSPVIQPSNSCGIKNGDPKFKDDQGKIVGGHNAQPQEWPWIAVLFNGPRQFCGGSLIDENHILTAAHCVAHMSSWDVAMIRVRLGDHNIRSDTEVQHVERKVKRVVRHRGFDSRTLYHDIAVITLDSPVAFSPVIRPICLPAAEEQYSGYTATVIGWGSIRENGPQPALLQEVSIPVWTNQMCKSKYGSAAPGGIHDGMLCAGQAAQDSCSGDSGGPLMVNYQHRYVQAGVVSWGIGCGKGQYPGVYARVSYYLPWISKNIKDV